MGRIFSIETPIIGPGGWLLPGWYFFDDDHEEHGPFETREEAETAFCNYIEGSLVHG